MCPRLIYRKIPKISPGAYIFQRPFLRGLSTEGNLRFKIDWASRTVGSKFTVFALFYSGRGGGGLYSEGRFDREQRVFCVTALIGLLLEGLTRGGDYFRNFTVLFFIIVHL